MLKRINLVNKLFFCVILLIAVGVCMSYSLSTYAVLLFDYDDFHFLFRQLVAGCLGIVIIWGLSYLNVEKYFFTLVFTIFIISFVLMIIVPFLPENIATSSNGAKRWIRLPFFSISPIELFKIGYIAFVSWSFSRKFSHLKVENFSQKFLVAFPHLVLFAIVAVIISTLQNDLGQVVLLALSVITLLLVAGGGFTIFATGIVGIGIAGSIFIIISPHRILRIKTWWASMQELVLAFLPDDFASQIRVENLPEGVQVYNATNAFSNGGFFGQGLGNGIFKLGFLSEVHTDFILAGIGEELGVIGIMLILLLFFVIFFYISKIAIRSLNSFYFLFCVGVICLIGYSFAINALGVVGITPVKGIAVPFLSYGGSSLVSSCICIGLVLAIGKNIKLV